MFSAARQSAKLATNAFTLPRSFGCGCAALMGLLSIGAFDGKQFRTIHWFAICLRRSFANLRKHLSKGLRRHVSPIRTESVAQLGSFPGQYCYREQSCVYCAGFANRECADRNSARHLNG